MNIRLMLAAFTCSAIFFGCADTMPDDTDRSEDEKVRNHDSDGAGFAKADGVQECDSVKSPEPKGIEFWSCQGKVELDGTSYRGTGTIKTSPYADEYRVSSEEIIVDVDRGPVEIEIQGQGGVLSRMENRDIAVMFAIYGRANPEAEWQEFTTWGPGYYSQRMFIEEDEFESRFDSLYGDDDEALTHTDEPPIATTEPYQLRIISVPILEMISHEVNGEYFYGLTVECGEGSCAG